MDSMPPIPDYKEQRLIAKGGMAWVYLATQESLGRQVAVKFMDPSKGGDDTFKKRFIRESKIITRLNHPHIITIYDIGEFQGYHYMIMEYVEGGTLAQRIKRRLSEKEAIDILRQIADALDYAHKSEIIHRDIKPTNILFRNDKTALLSDFGIAKDLQSTALTDAGWPIGSPAYMSPEQELAAGSIDSRSDLYSLGVVFYEMLTGKRPERHSVPRLPKTLARYQKIIDKLLVENPNKRFTTAEQLINALNALDGGKRILPSWAYWFSLTVLLVPLIIYWYVHHKIPVGDKQPPASRYVVDKPLRFQVQYVYRSGSRGPVQPLVDGSELHSEDSYKIQFTPLEDSYVYIFQLDSSQTIDRLFPMQGFQGLKVNNFNQVQAGMTYVLPSKDKHFWLDNQSGWEQIFFVASRQPDEVLENQYDDLLRARLEQRNVEANELQMQILQNLRTRRLVTASRNPDKATASLFWTSQEIDDLPVRYLDKLCAKCVDIVTFKHD